MVVKGEFLRKAERLNMRVTLGFARPGDLAELAAALACQQHTYALTALTAGTVLLLPLDALQEAFDRHPPLRMKLLEELAREVFAGLPELRPESRNPHPPPHQRRRSRIAAPGSSGRDQSPRAKRNKMG